jgi:sugar diacid utilization regulator
VGKKPAKVTPTPRAAEDDGRSWTSQLQTIVDEASRVLGRPMVLTDGQRMLAYTEHAEDEVDQMRLMAILKRPPPLEPFEWGRRHAPRESEQPFRVPSNPALEYDARVVAPIHSQGHHLGLLSCIDRDAAMTDADLERLGAFADEAAVVMYREMLLQDLNRSRERELLRDILSSDETICREAAWQLAEEDLFTAGGRVVVLVVPLDDDDEDGSPEDTRVAAEAILMRIRRQVAPKHSLHLVRPGHALLLVSLADPGIRRQGVKAFAQRIHGDIAEALSRHRQSERQVVAVGAAARALAEAAASYEQALRAANVAATVSSFEDVICWDDLGIYQMLTGIPIGAFGDNALHPGLRTLLDDPRLRHLIPALERYLDLAGDAQRTAAALYMHRTTLYHRLRRIEREANVDLRKGDDRLALHLSLKIARLQGEHLAHPSEKPAADNVPA